MATYKVETDKGTYEIETEDPKFSAQEFMGKPGVVTPQDIVSGMLPVKGGDILADFIKKRAQESISSLPQKPMMPSFIPKTPFDVGMGMAGKMTPQEFATSPVGEIALDPRTFVPSSISQKARRPLDILLKASQEAIKPRALPGGLAKMGAFMGGIKNTVLEDVAQEGYRNVLQKKYYNKRLPAQLWTNIQDNLKNLYEGVGVKYKEATSQLENIPFAKEWDEIKNSLSKLSEDVRKNVFKGDTKQINTIIVDGINSAKVDTVGDVLKLRRDLDEVIYSASGKGVKSEFAQSVRKSFNKVLHRNKVLEAVDKKWSSIQDILRDIGDKVTSDTGENFLKRIVDLTAEQKHR